MSYEPKVMFNPSDERIDFMYDHQTYVFEPGEKKLLNKAVTDHVIRFLNSDLKVYEPETDDIAVTSSDVAYDKMSWLDVKSLAAKRGLFKLGMKKDEVIKALVEADEQGS